MQFISLMNCEKMIIKQVATSICEIMKENHYEYL